MRDHAIWGALENVYQLYESTPTVVGWFITFYNTLEQEIQYIRPKIGVGIGFSTNSLSFEVVREVWMPLYTSLQFAPPRSAKLFASASPEHLVLF